MNRCHKNARVKVCVRLSAEPCAHACMCVFLIAWTGRYVRSRVRVYIQTHVNVL